MAEQDNDFLSGYLSYRSLNSLLSTASTEGFFNGVGTVAQVFLRIGNTTKQQNPTKQD